MTAAIIESGSENEEVEERLARSFFENEVEGLSEAERAEGVDRLAQLLRLDSLRLLAKANRLQFVHERLLRSSDIISDLRPVFGGEESLDVGGFVIWHTLRLQYTNGIAPEQESEAIDIALDGQDLESLQEQLTRAIDKHKSLKKKMAEVAMPHYTVGDLQGDEA